MARVSLVGSRVPLCLLQRRPEVLARLLGLKNGCELAVMQEDAVCFCTIEMISPALASDREVGDVPTAFTEVFFNEDFGFVFVDIWHSLHPVCRSWKITV